MGDTIIKLLENRGVVTVIGFLIGALSRPIISMWEVYWRQPSLTIKHDTANTAFHVVVDPSAIPGVSRALYKRVGVENISGRYSSIARDCRIYLISVQEVNNSEEFLDIGFADTVRLRMAYEGNDGGLHGGVDIPKDVTVYFDICTVQCRRDSSSGQERSICELETASPHTRSRFSGLLEIGKTYRLGLMLTGDGVKTKRAFLRLMVRDVFDMAESNLY